MQRFEVNKRVRIIKVFVHFFLYFLGLDCCYIGNFCLERAFLVNSLLKSVEVVNLASYDWVSVEWTFSIFLTLKSCSFCSYWTVQNLLLRVLTIFVLNETNRIKLLTACCFLDLVAKLIDKLRILSQLCPLLIISWLTGGCHVESLVEDCLGIHVQVVNLCQVMINLVLVFMQPFVNV